MRFILTAGLYGESLEAPNIGEALEQADECIGYCGQDVFISTDDGQVLFTRKWVGGNEDIIEVCANLDLNVFDCLPFDVQGFYLPWEEIDV